MKNNIKAKFDNMFFLFPVYAGILFVIANNAVLCQVKKQGNIHLQTCNEKQIITNNMPFLRGVEYIINCFVVYIKYFALSLNNYLNNENKKNNDKKSKKIFFFKILIILLNILLICLISWFLFWFLPAQIGFGIFPNNYNLFLKNLCVGLVKCLILWLAIFALRCFINIKNLLQLNTAGNMAIGNGESFCALNFLNVLVGALLIDFFVVSLIGLNARWLVEFVFQVGMFFMCCGISFEINFFVEKSQSKFVKKIKAITCVLFYAPPSKTDKQIAFCGCTEGERMRECGEDYKEINLTTSQNCYPISLVLSEVKNALKKAGIEDFGEAEWLVACVLGCKKLDLKLVEVVDIKQYEIIQDVLKRRVNNEPLAKIFGETEFYGLKFVVNKNVLTPRQETEILVENLLKEKLSDKKNVEILDLCTGSGAIGITLAYNLPNAQVLAVDISEEALFVAQKNADKNKIKNIKFKQSDLFSNIKRHKKFDVIVSNPPYIATDEISKLDKEVKNFDPILALDGGVDGLYFYKKIAREVPNFLKQNGKLYLEIGFNQGAKVKKILTQDFESIKIIKDYAGLPRVVVATKKG